DNGDRPVYPCDTHGPEGVDPPNIVCVGMTDRSDAPDCQSNVGGSVDLYAPGRQIFSTVKNSAAASQPWGVTALTGTSMSAAVVAGVAALAVWAEPEFLGVQLKDRLTNAVDTPPGVTNGRINAARAVGESHDTDGFDL